MSQSPNYCIQARNATAVNILRSWLRAANVPTAPAAPGFDLAVVDVLSEVQQVKVVMKDEPAAPTGITVQASDITGRKESVALAAFYTITDSAGYERVAPINRGGNVRLNEKGNPRKLHYKDEGFMVSIRHTEFRRSPNPADDRWKQYKAVMEKVVWKFFQSNYEMCCRQAVDIKDLLQVARCLMVNFCARYETPTPVWNDNERKFYRYLQQRFHYDVRAIMVKSERSLMPDSDTVRTALACDSEASPDPTDAYVAALDAPEEDLSLARAIFAGSSTDASIPESLDVADEVDEDYIERHCVLDTSSTSARRSSAAAKLTDLLANMPHDSMVRVLREASENFAFDFVTRKEAYRQLRLHEQKCDSCASVQSGAEEDEELAGTDSLGAEE